MEEIIRNSVKFYENYYDGINADIVYMPIEGLRKVDCGQGPLVTIAIHEIDLNQAF